MVLPNPLTSAKTVSCFFNNAWREEGGEGGRGGGRGGGRERKRMKFVSFYHRERVTQREKKISVCTEESSLSLSLFPHFSHVFVFPIVRATHYWLNVLHPQFSLECIREILLSFVRVFKNLLT